MTVRLLQVFASYADIRNDEPKNKKNGAPVLAPPNSRSSNKKSKKSNCGTPDIAIEGNGQWVKETQSNGQIKWIIKCNGPRGIPAPTKLQCHSKKGWIKRGPTVCFNPPPIPDFLDDEEIRSEQTQFKCWTEDHTPKTASGGGPRREPQYKNWKANGQYAWTLYM